MEINIITGDTDSFGAFAMSGALLVADRGRGDVWGTDLSAYATGAVVAGSFGAVAVDGPTTDKVFVDPPVGVPPV